MSENLIRARADALAGEIVALRRDIYQHPELSNREARTAALVAARLEALGLEVTRGVAGHGVVGLLTGARGNGRTVAARANMDALPIADALDVPYRSVVPGVKHACGHDVEAAILVGVATVLADLRRDLAGRFKFIFQPAEEGLPPPEVGGAKQMIAEGVLENPGVEEIVALHVMPTHEVGSLAYASGPTLASNDNFEITVTGKQTHAAFPHAGVDPIVIATHVLQVLQGFASRECDAIEPVVVSPCVVRGGNYWNIIPDEVLIQGTVRTLSPELRTRIPALMEARVTAIAAAMAGGSRFLYHYVNPVTINDHALTKAAVPILERVAGAGRVVRQLPIMASEDFAHFAQQVPAFYFFLGVGNAARGIVHMVHSPLFNVDEACIPLGIAGLSSLLVERARPRAVEPVP